MTWIPTSAKIINFGDSWSDNMLIPEQNDAVLGENDPGVGTVVISSMGSASGQAFAYIENNLQYIRNIMLFDNITIAVSNVTELQSALDVLDKITFIQKGVTFQISISVGSYAWPIPTSETKSAINISGVHGSGTVTIEPGFGGITITGNCNVSRPLIKVENSTCRVNINGEIILVNDLSGGSGYAAVFDNVSNVTVVDLDVRNENSGDTLDSAVYCNKVKYLNLSLTADTNVGTNTGIARSIRADNGSKIYIDEGKINLGNLTFELLKLDNNSELILERFDGFVPAGADLGLLTFPSSIDGSSAIKADTLSASGAGTESNPYVVTVTWESSSLTPLHINEFIRLLPKPLNDWIRLKLPAGTMIASIEIYDVYGDGGVILEGNTKLSSRGVTQDTIVDRSSTAIKIENCDAPVHLHSIKADSDTGEAIRIENSFDVRVEYCYVVTGASGDNGVFAIGPRTIAYVNNTIAGYCGGAGIRAEYGATVYTVYNDDGGSGTPQSYGQEALYSGSIYRSDGAGESIPGVLGATFENLGGKVFSS